MITRGEQSKHIYPALTEMLLDNNLRNYANSFFVSQQVKYYCGYASRRWLFFPGKPRLIRLFFFFLYQLSAVSSNVISNTTAAANTNLDILDERYSKIVAQNSRKLSKLTRPSPNNSLTNSSNVNATLSADSSAASDEQSSISSVEDADNAVEAMYSNLSAETAATTSKLNKLQKANNTLVNSTLYSLDNANYICAEPDEVAPFESDIDTLQKLPTALTKKRELLRNRLLNSQTLTFNADADSESIKTNFADSDTFVQTAYADLFARRKKNIVTNKATNTAKSVANFKNFIKNSDMLDAETSSNDDTNSNLYQPRALQIKMRKSIVNKSRTIKTKYLISSMFCNSAAQHQIMAPDVHLNSYEPNKLFQMKPGYSTIWRNYRSAYAAVSPLRYFRQRRWTNYFLSLRNIRGVPAIWFLEFSVVWQLVHSHFCKHVIEAYMIVKQHLVYVNNANCSEPTTQIYVGDSISLKFSCVTALLQITECANLRHTKRKLNLLLTRNWQYRLSNHIRLRNQVLIQFDVPNYLEVDFTTMTAVLLYMPVSLFEFNPLISTTTPMHAMRVYNWKYIT